MCCAWLLLSLSLIICFGGLTGSLWRTLVPSCPVPSFLSSLCCFWAQERQCKIEGGLMASKAGLSAEYSRKSCVGLVSVCGSLFQLELLCSSSPRRFRVLLIKWCLPQRVSGGDLSVSVGCVDHFLSFQDHEVCNHTCLWTLTHFPPIVMFVTLVFEQGAVGDQMYTCQLGLKTVPCFWGCKLVLSSKKLFN